MGCTHTFGSKISDMPNGSRFGLYLYGSKGAIFVPVTKYPAGEPSLLKSPSWLPDAKSGGWTRIDAPGGKRVERGRPPTRSWRLT